MAKTKVLFICQECGHESLKWLGRCPGCGAWNTMTEEVQVKTASGRKVATGTPPQLIQSINTEAMPRISSGIREVDRVLGGGIVPGALILLGGDPGIGKSTLILQVACAIQNHKGPILYVSGEESAVQTKMRADRLKLQNSNMMLMTETNLAEIITQAEQLKPELLIIDSIQTMFNPELPSAPGSVGQVRESTGKLLRLAKDHGIATVIIGHVTKEGNIAGPRLLEHMVDVVLYLEGERNYAFRVLRAMKNRFGSTTESGIFTMEEEGLVEVLNPSALLLSERPENAPGSVVLASIEGVRPLLIEIQALVSTTVFGMPRRMAAGFDYNRVMLLMAVLEKRVGLGLGNQDAYVNAVGGMKVIEPAADLAVALALVSSYRNIAVHEQTVVMGEIGLTGEVRMVSHAETRIKEAVTLGFRRFVLPKGNIAKLKKVSSDIEIIGVSQVNEAMEAVGL